MKAAPRSPHGLRILITNISMRWRSGTTLYVRDLALELQRQGHLPAVFTLEMGEVGAELRAAGILVTDRLQKLMAVPHIIHGHHYLPTMAAINHFPAAPALFVCHDHTSHHDKTPLHPRIYRYLGVSNLCLERLRREAAPAHLVQLMPNFVDIRRFTPRPPLPPRPAHALVFSNYANGETHVPAVAAACRETGLLLDVVGLSAGTAVARPEDILGHYDLVFAKGKAAMEAMAVGAAVVLCDRTGVGPLVTAAQFDRLRPLNFGFQALQQPLHRASLVAQIAAYDPQDAASVRDMMRSSAALDQAVRRLTSLYQDIITDHRQVPASPYAKTSVRLYRQRYLLKMLSLWVSLPPTIRSRAKTLPLVGTLLHRIQSLMLPSNKPPSVS